MLGPLDGVAPPPPSPVLIYWYPLLLLNSNGKKREKRRKERREKRKAPTHLPASLPFDNISNQPLPLCLDQWDIRTIALVSPRLRHARQQDPTQQTPAVIIDTRLRMTCYAATPRLLPPVDGTTTTTTTPQCSPRVPRASPMPAR